MDGYLGASQALGQLGLLITQRYGERSVERRRASNWQRVDEEADNIVTFVRALPAEQMVHLWNSVMATKNMGPIKALHGRIGDEIVKVIREARELGKN